MIHKSNDNEIKLLCIGSCSSDGSQGGAVYLVDGLAPTICACTHGYAIGNILIVPDELILKKP